VTFYYHRGIFSKAFQLFCWRVSTRLVQKACLSQKELATYSRKESRATCHQMTVPVLFCLDLFKEFYPTYQA